MSEASKKSNRKTSGGSRSVTSSPGSASGVTPLETLDGQMIFPLGQEAVPASLSVRAGSGEASQITVTYGLHGSGLSESHDLSISLANKYRVLTASHGSTLFRLTWKTRRTHAGRSIPARRASAHRTFVNGCTSWPSPMAGTPAQNGYNEAGNNDSSRKTVALASWPTPNHNTTGAGTQGREGGENLQTAAQMIGWPTPTADDPNNAMRKSGQFKSLTRDSHLVGTSWSSPSARDWKDTPGMAKETEDRARLDQLPRQAHLASEHSGNSNGTNAQTAGSGPFLLNPRFSLWLQGLPDAWASCAEQAIASALHKRKRLSGRALK